ncbi:MAG: CHAT domain-containing protein [Gemmataceae bacterium]|nr:CHAT domain-containing protein [Gemmataceae bacterium]
MIAVVLWIAGAAPPVADRGTMAARHEEARAAWRAGRRADALLLLRAVHERQSALLGPHRVPEATAYELSVWHRRAGDERGAIRWRRRVRSIQEALDGPGHWKAVEAGWFFSTVAQVAGMDWGERLELALVVGMGFEALQRYQAGGFAAVLPMVRQIEESTARLLGRGHPYHCEALNSLALVLYSTGDEKGALPLIRQALAARREALGEKHPTVAESFNSLAGLLSVLGEDREAVPFFEESLRIEGETLGKRTKRYATGLQNLANTRANLGDHAEARRLTEEALAMRKSILGEEHRDYATSLHALACLRDAEGDRAGAFALHRKVRRIREKAMGPRHPLVADALAGMAGIAYQENRPSAALPLCERCLAIVRANLESVAAVQSERQQLAAAAALHHVLYLRLVVADGSPSASHSHVLVWKGAAFSAQSQRRAFARASADPRTREEAEALLDATRTLATRSLRGDPKERDRVEELARRKDELEARLSAKSAGFRARKPLGSEELRRSLPPGVALVDFLHRIGTDPAKPLKGEVIIPRFTAWVLRRDAPTVRIDLGHSASIEDSVKRWRAALEKGGDDAGARAFLRRFVWMPLEKHLAGASAVVVSPDGALARLPFAALPGTKSAYLLEEVALAVLPVPQALPEMLAPVEGKRSLLAVGDVDFGEGRTWSKLPATRPETDAAGKRFRDGATLRGAKATKAAVRAALPRHRYAHLATHGFFAPDSMRSALERGTGQAGSLFERDGVGGWHPGLLSGLALAGANRPTERDDGILTASEIADLDLSRMELAVLSACQTGLGKEAAGEGVLGLQRAFAVAGCRSVVSSLWSVNDAATSVLMDRFYHHLLREKRTKLEALRQAQLDVLRNPGWVDARLKELRSAKVEARGPGKAVKIEGARGATSPPLWWAAWQLSGDWR